MSPDEREGLPPVPRRPEEIADAVLMFVEDETMAGRVMVWREGEPEQLAPADSPYLKGHYRAAFTTVSGILFTRVRGREVPRSSW